MKNNSTKFLAIGGIIAALYVVLTMLATALGLSSGAIQVRFSEALCILPVFSVAAIPGLFIGCIISNILSGCILFDVLFGSIATLIGAIGTYLLRNKSRYIAVLPPIISNAVIVPLVLKYAYGLEDAYWYLVATVGLGEIISVGILGLLVYKIFDNQHILKEKISL